MAQNRLEIKHAYLLGKLEQLQELTELPVGALQAEVQNQLIQVRELWEEVLRQRRDEGRSQTPRFFWESVTAGRITLDDPKFCTIGNYKIAPYWQIEIEKLRKTIILPPSDPFFVGKAGDPPNDDPPTEGYIAKIYDLISNQITCGKDLKYLWNSRWKLDKGTGEINQRLKEFDGTFYLDYLDNESDRIWKVRWGRKHRELLKWDDEFLLEVICQVEAIANKQKPPQQVWEWLDSVETSFAAKAIYQGREITLKPYLNGNYYEWRLTYKRQPKWVSKRDVNWIYGAMKRQRLEDVVKYHLELG
jgi:hypothetical protein